MEHRGIATFAGVQHQMRLGFRGLRPRPTPERFELTPAPSSVGSSLPTLAVGITVVAEMIGPGALTRKLAAEGWIKVLNLGSTTTVPVVELESEPGARFDAEKHQRGRKRFQQQQRDIPWFHPPITWPRHRRRSR